VARDERGIIQQIFADTGDVAEPTFDFAEGWPVAYAQAGGQTPEREVFNRLFQRLFALGYDVTRFGGALPWDVAINYALNALVSGSDGKMYLGKQASGPDADVGAVDPVEDIERACWGPITADLAEYLQNADIGIKVLAPNGDGSKLTGINVGIYLASSATPSATAAKAAACADFVLTPGASVLVTFDNENSLSAALTLNVNDTGALPIVDQAGNAISSTNPAYFPAGCQIEFVYNGSKWVHQRRVVESYKSGTTWYRIYSDGWIVQGLEWANTATSPVMSLSAATITLPVAHRDVNYSVLKYPVAGPSLTPSLSYGYQFHLGTRNTGSFTINVENKVYFSSIVFQTAGF